MPRDYTAEDYWNGLLNASLCKLFILRALREGPGHGYEIVRRVDRLTKGFCVPTEGTIYPVLREFEEGGYVTAASEVVSGRERKVYTLTDKGRAAFKVAVEAWMDVTRCLVDAEKMIAGAPDKVGSTPGCCP